MAVSPDRIREILNFCPEREASRDEVDLGEIDGGMSVVYGPTIYQQRAIYLPGG